MTLAQRLLAYPSPAPGVRILTTATAGGWTQIPEAHAIYYNGHTYFGYVNGANGNIEIRSYNHSTGITSAATVMHAALDSPADTHDAPGLLIRDSDKHIVASYSAHNGAALYVWISTNPEDISAGTETDISGSVGVTAVTYANVIQRLAETNSPIYIFYRDVRTGTAYLTYTKSSDGGSTWSAHMDVYRNPGHATYWKITSDGQWRIDFVVTSDGPPTASSIYHFYADATDYHASDGTAIGAYQPFDTTHLTLVYDGSTNAGWPTDVCLDGGNNPRVVFNASTSGNTDSTFGYARWTGSAWTLSTIVASVGFGIVDPSQVACLDATVLTQCHLVQYVSGHHELWRYTTADSGATWSGSPLTVASSVDNLYPTSVKGGHPTDLAVLWLDGTYTSATSSSLGIKGVAQ